MHCSCIHYDSEVRLRRPIILNLCDMASRYAGMPISESRCGLPSVRVRPLPKNLPHYVRRARMCDGTWCRGPNDCTFAHNELELNQWNMLLQQRGMYSIERCVMRGINYLSLGGKAGLLGSKIRNLFIIFVVIFILKTCDWQTRDG